MKIINVEQGTPEWHKARAGLPTASAVGKLITATGKVSTQYKGYAEQLAQELITGMPADTFGGNVYTEYGHEHEPIARACYGFENDRTDLQTVGFVVSDCGNFGASPDTLVGDEGLVEIKCLPVKHTSVLMQYAQDGKLTSDYVHQSQYQLLVTNRKWCDLYFYHPSEEIRNLCVRIEADAKVQGLICGQLGKTIAYRNRCIEEIATSPDALKRLAA